MHPFSGFSRLRRRSPTALDLVPRKLETNIAIALNSAPMSTCSMGGSSVKSGSDRMDQFWLTTTLTRLPRESFHFKTPSSATRVQRFVMRASAFSRSLCQSFCSYHGTLNNSLSQLRIASTASRGLSSVKRSSAIDNRTEYVGRPWA